MQVLKINEWMQVNKPEYTTTLTDDIKTNDNNNTKYHNTGKLKEYKRGVVGDFGIVVETDEYGNMNYTSLGETVYVKQGTGPYEKGIIDHIEWVRDHIDHDNYADMECSIKIDGYKNSQKYSTNISCQTWHREFIHMKENDKYVDIKKTEQINIIDLFNKYISSLPKTIILRDSMSLEPEEIEIKTSELKPTIVEKYGKYGFHIFYGELDIEYELALYKDGWRIILDDWKEKRNVVTKPELWDKVVF